MRRLCVPSFSFPLSSPNTPVSATQSLAFLPWAHYIHTLPSFLLPFFPFITHRRFPSLPPSLPPIHPSTHLTSTPISHPTGRSRLARTQLDGDLDRVRTPASARGGRCHARAGRSPPGEYEGGAGDVFGCECGWGVGVGLRRGEDEWMDRGGWGKNSARFIPFIS